MLQLQLKNVYSEYAVGLIMEFGRIFGVRDIHNEPCTVVNDPDAELFGLIADTKPIILQTAVDMTQPSNLFRAQYIYQLAYGLTQYALRQQKPDPDVIVKWFENTVCDAMAIYMLEQLANNWRRYADTANLNADDVCDMKLYACEQQYAHAEKDVLDYCRDLNDLKLIEADSDINRKDRGQSRNYILNTLRIPDMDRSISQISDYTQYINDDKLTIDFERWADESRQHALLIANLGDIQPNIES